MNESRPAPFASTQRHDVLDALRGNALFGVLLVNLPVLSLDTLAPAAELLALPTAAWDRLMGVIMAAVIDIKSATQFSLLFGFGFALHMQRAAGDRDVARRY
jgi:uncharacterized protein